MTIVLVPFNATLFKKDTSLCETDLECQTRVAPAADAFEGFLPLDVIQLRCLLKECY
jgi:hypothetical protein